VPESEAVQRLHPQGDLQSAQQTGVKNAALGVALKRALRAVNGEGSLSSQASAGFILEPGKKGEREGVQVFVTAERFSEKAPTK